MSDIFILDDRPDNDPEVIARREKEWNELPQEIRERIDREVEEGIARMNARKQKKNKN